MGYKHDQRLPSELHDEQLAAALQESQDPPPPYPGRETLNLAGSDPRNTSQESLAPVESRPDGKRTLLLIYIHGFMGNETSFQEFPAHIHSLLARQVSDTHVIHTKIYPRYKTRYDVSRVRDQFSNWLVPHEQPTTDILLLGHSMGGIVAADVALLPSAERPGSMKHRLLGTINLDVPFLGMHPGIIGAGLNSIFGNMAAPPHPAHSADNNEASENAMTADENVAMLPMPPSEPGAAEPWSSSSSISSPLRSPSLMIPDNDPGFNPSFANDVPVPVRKPVDNFFHFIDKHFMKAENSGELFRAGRDLITSHLQFGGSMAQYTKLNDRYKQLRALEKDPTRVRFVNFFSTCYGRPKPPKPPKLPPRAADAAAEEETDIGNEAGDKDGKAAETELAGEKEDRPDDAEDDTPDIGMLTMRHTDPIPESEEDIGNEADAQEENVSSEDEFEDANEKLEQDLESAKAARIQEKLDLLPPVPAEPTAPAAFDESAYNDKDAQKLAKQQHARETRAYIQSVKDRHAAVKEREKLVAKIEKENSKSESKKVRDEQKAALKKAREEEKAVKKAAKDKELAQKKEEKQWQREQKLEEKARVKEGKQKQKAESEKRDRDDMLDEDDKLSEQAPAREKEKKLKTFCLTPPKSTTGQRADWVPVFVKDTDQVTAHCGLFDPERPHYEAFVQQVVDLVNTWADEMEGTHSLA